ncbi:MAG TPA: hypothetical protein VGG84_16800 [Gemmatimonadaceae bacterium]
MRSAVRLVLSSVVVITACTPPAVSTPGPHFVEVHEVVLGTARAGDADTLSVKIDGPTAVRAASSVRFTATVVNKSDDHHYYWWFVANCATRGGCAPSSYVLVGEGQDMTSLTLRFRAENAEQDVVVQVAEIEGRGRTGSSVEFPVMGPSQRQGDGSEGFASSVCDWYAGSFYPHVGEYTDPFSGRTWKRRFRRDYCGNRVSWSPEN